MGWSLGHDRDWKRDIGYGVPAFCDHPKCNAEINRGLSYVCGSEKPYGGDEGCGLFFCGEHHDGCKGEAYNLCPRCTASKPPYRRPKPEHPEWIAHKLTDLSWAEWRAENPAEVERLRASISDEELAARVKELETWAPQEEPHGR